MSPSWRDRVSVFFAPEHVHLARYAKGWKPAPAIGHSIACGERGVTEWQSALEALQRGLANLGWQGADATVTVSNHFVRYALVPAAGKLRGEGERTAAAASAEAPGTRAAARSPRSWCSTTACASSSCRARPSGS